MNQQKLIFQLLIADDLNYFQYSNYHTKTNMIEVGKKAPAFTLMGADKEKHKLSDYDKAIVYFYPRDNTPGCTLQATDFTKFKKDLLYFFFSKVIGMPIFLA